MTRGRGTRTLALRWLAAGWAGLIPGFLLLGIPAEASGLEPEVRGDIAVELRVRGGEEGSFRPGQEVTFYFQADESCYLVLYNIDPQGRVRLLYPEDPGESAWVTGEQTYRVPSGGAAYDLLLGNELGIELIGVAASSERINVSRWFPNGQLEALDEIYSDEGLDEEGLSRDSWVEEDPFLAMDLINRRLVPERRRSAGYGEAYLTLRVGDEEREGEESDSGYGVRHEVQVVHHYHYYDDPLLWDLYDDPFFGDPFYARTCWHRPWWWSGPRAHFVVTYYDPFWDPWWGVDPYWGMTVGYRSGYAPWAFSWWYWPVRERREICRDPANYWGSRIKWKSSHDVTGGQVVKWKEGTVSPVAAGLGGVKAPAPQVAKLRLEPTSPSATAKVRRADAVRSTAKVRRADERGATTKGEAVGRRTEERETVTVKGRAEDRSREAVERQDNERSRESRDTVTPTRQKSKEKPEKSVQKQEKSSRETRADRSKESSREKSGKSESSGKSAKQDAPKQQKARRP